jgi:AraC family transcriptional regulator
MRFRIVYYALENFFEGRFRNEMDYYKRIQSAIDFIEKNLQEDLKITNISSEACFSAFHFQRLFQAISGFSVHEYIRKRRLSEAAILLRETNWNILEIAISFGYGSQEAFSRAFEAYFEVSPAIYRKTVTTTIRQQFKINFLDYKIHSKEELSMNKPDIIELEAIQIVGYEYKTNLLNDQYFADIPQFYYHFGENQYYLHIPNKTSPNRVYGIACNYTNEDDFSFIIGVEVEAVVDAFEDGFVEFEIPQGKYAVFKAFGTVDLVQETRKYIYGTWLPNSNYELRGGIDFEVTDVMNSSFPHDLKITIYIPIR